MIRNNCLVSTISSQLLMTVFAVCCVDVSMVCLRIGVNSVLAMSLAWALLLLLPISLYLTRTMVLIPKLRTDMLTRKGSAGLSLLFPIQTLHLPSRKVFDGALYKLLNN